LDVSKTHVYEEGLAHISEIGAKKLKQLEMTNTQADKLQKSLRAVIPHPHRDFGSTQAETKDAADVTLTDEPTRLTFERHERGAAILWCQLSDKRYEIALDAVPRPSGRDYSDGFSGATDGVQLTLQAKRPTPDAGRNLWERKHMRNFLYRPQSQ
jgi:hypothetical protein